ncbi:metallophosphoesterase [Gaoshiqia sp. Z1-71]|uniref:metallophosphoesterase n=1 Tax=Gaoshiqia hydrogeniformans TaxID=3290090 RepID=UPI003BF8D581
MRGIPGSAVLIFILFILLTEALAYWAIIRLIHERKLKKRVSLFYLGVTIVFLVIWLMAFLNPDKIRQTSNYQFFYFVIFISFLNIIPKTVISLFAVSSLPFHLLKKKISSQVILLCGMILSLGIILNIGYAVAFGKKTIRTELVELTLPGLPESLDQLKIIQISDIHLGSFENDQFLERCAREINRHKPDLIFFTGDIVNNYYQEILGFEEHLKAMQATYGKFAILGNHDYGDYSDWQKKEDKIFNRQMVNQKLIEAGFRLLLNESELVVIGDTSIAVIGVENWGHEPFPQYANLKEAMKGLPENSFQILLTHDPSHWESQVINQTNAHLTLSGHTHGGQFALKIAGIEFSPISLIQKHWGGLYRHDKQYLYVNRGIGCVGFPGRIDMAPEITVITLRSNGVKID